MVRWIIIGCFVLSTVPVIHAQDKEDLQRQKQKALEEIEMARELIQKTEEKRINSVHQIQLLESGIASRKKVIKTVTEEVTLLDKDIQETQQEIRKLEIRNERNKEEYARMIYFAYRNHTDYEKLMYILAGESITQSYQRYKYLKYISDYRKRMAKDIEENIGLLETKNHELTTLKDQKLSLLEEKEIENNRLIRERQQKNSLVADLQKEENKLKNEIREKERIAAELEERIRKIIEEEASRLNASSIYNSLTPEQRLVSVDFAKNIGKLPWPVERGVVTSPFGKQEITGLRGSTYTNNGIDISSNPGTLVRAVFNGEVTKVFAILGANYTVLIRHGEFLTVYQNLVNVRVKTGDTVVAKQVLGEMYTDEEHSVAEIHFEVWKERSILNPQDWLSR